MSTRDGVDEDDMVDAWIHEAWCMSPDSPCHACVEEPEARIRAALAIHKPCHTADTPDYACTEGHIGDGSTGRPDSDQHALCISCTYDDRTVRWPCPTAVALGMVTPVVTVGKAIGFIVAEKHRDGSMSIDYAGPVYPDPVRARDWVTEPGDVVVAVCEVTA